MVSAMGWGPTTKGVLAAMLLAGIVAQTPSAQVPLPPSVLEGAIDASATRRQTVVLNAGDIVTGTFELKDTSGVMLVSDPAGRRISKTSLSLSEPARTAFGFLAETGGEYLLQVISTGPRNGSYTLTYRVRKPESAAGIVVAPTIRYPSARITQLTAELKAARPDALARFWADAAAAHGTFIEPITNDNENVYATFVWRQTFVTYNVRLIRPPNSRTAQDYYLTRLPGTDVWYKTMKVHRSTRFAYSFAPNDIPDEEYFVSVADPLNSNLFPGDIDHSDWTPDSVFIAPGAPDDRWATATPAQRGTVTDRTLDSTLLKARFSIAMYTPPGYSADRGPYPLLILFNGPAYNSDVVAAPRILDNLIAAGRIRPAVVCFISNAATTAENAAVNAILDSNGNRRFNPVFADAMATDVLPWLRRSYAISADPLDHVVGGFSIGANTAFFLALRHPEVFGSVLSQDGTPGVGRALPQMFIDGPKSHLRVYMVHSVYNLPDTSVDEIATLKDTLGSGPRLRDVLLAKGHDVTYREAGGTHDWLYVRSTLPDALMALLPARASTPQ